jgi:selenide,water dikinase
MAADPQSVLVLATVPYGNPPKQTEILYHLLCGVQKVLGQRQIPLVGGHTSEGAELTLGFACNGLAEPHRILRKGGMTVGDTLILTRPLGTGILFAADMQLQAKGRWIEAAIAAMLQSNQQAGHCLRDCGATACTDVTGFGLLGHLWEMVEASRVGVELTLTQLPLLDGVTTALQQGHLSSLHDQNSQVATAIDNADRYRKKLEFPVLFDPQTSGGLLASVPPHGAERCLQRLRQAGYDGVVIGEVVAPTRPDQPIHIKQW